jgi:isoleucyl-tRNA synthetase
VVALGRAARRQAGLRVRQPLARLLVVAGPRERAALELHRDDLLEELNVKALELLDSASGLLRHRLRPNLRLLGPRLGRLLPALRAALESLTPAQAAGLLARAAAGEPAELVLDGQPVGLTLDELLVETGPLEGYAAAQEGHLQVALDTALTEELRREGAARDLVRAVQEARKQAGLAVSERVVLYLPALDELDPLLAEWGAYLCAETLCARLERAAPPEHARTAQLDLGGVPLTLGLVPQ